MADQKIDNVHDHLKAHVCHHRDCHQAAIDHQAHQVPEPDKARQQNHASAPHRPSPPPQAKGPH